MPLSNDERQDCVDKAIAFIVTEFNKEFQELYSVATATTGVHPEQVNNEIRNMLTHLARALEADCAASADKEVKLAAGHLERAKRDCLKLSNLHILKTVKSDAFYIGLRDGPRAFPRIQRLRAIEKELIRVRMLEVEGNNSCLEELLKANADLQEFMDDYAKDGFVPNVKLKWWENVWLWVRLNVSGIVVGLMIAIVSTIFFEVLIKPHVPWLNKPASQQPQDPELL